MKENIFKDWNLIAIIIVCLVMGFLVGNKYELGSMKKESHEVVAAHDMDMHKHAQIPAGYKVPTIKVSAIPDTMGGYNVNVETSNFRFTPENAGKSIVPNTGHAHIYINGKKIGRIYGNWYYVGPTNFTSGTNTISVTLNADNHDVWVLDDGKTEITGSVDVLVK